MSDAIWVALVPLLVPLCSSFDMFSSGWPVHAEKGGAQRAGIFEKEPGSGIWWIRYKIDRIEKREKVGRRGDAIKLYQLRRADAIRGVKLPANMRHRGIRFRVIGEEALTGTSNTAGKT